MPLLEPLIETQCSKCGIVDEARLEYAGPHIKHVCNNCGAYKRFINVTLIPDVKEIRQRIWATAGDKDVIEEAKKKWGVDILLPAVHKPIDLKMLWWRVYLEVRKKVNV